MKKEFIIPEISSHELNTEDVMLTSQQADLASNRKFTAIFSDALTTDLDMYKNDDAWL